MFLKMLKSDLKRKKGLNVILFLFITVAAMLVFAGSVQIFSNFTREQTAKVLCRSSDLLFWTMDNKGDKEEIRRSTVEVLEKESVISDWSSAPITRIGIENLDFPDFDEKTLSSSFRNKIQYLTTLPLEHDLLYDLNDEPFYVPNGSIAIPVSVSLNTGTKKGGIIRLTTDTGNTYELEVSCIFKDSIGGGLPRYIVSEEDYKVLSRDSIRRYTCYSLRLSDTSDAVKDSLISAVKDKDVPMVSMYTNSVIDNDYVMLRIISVFLIIISLFLIIIIFLTIRFTMIADLKSEEKEIGMMKALGIDSFSFRWIFAAKYIAFAVVGGVIGIAAGLPLAGMLVNMFGPDSILPERYIMLLIGILSVAVMITAMIAFSLLVMQRIKKISVIDAIHGENRGERFGKGSPMFLHKRKKMSVPLFLALTDILGRFKCYLFLIISYSLGAAILLLAFNVRNTIIDPHYARYWLDHDYDFNIRFSEKDEDEITRRMQKTGSDYGEAVNEMLAEAGIPAHIDFMNYGSAEMELEDGSTSYFDVLWKAGEPEKFVYRKGGTAPRLANEGAMSAYTAQKIGVKTGDVLKMTINENNADHTGRVKNEREIVITGLIDYMENGTGLIILGDEYEGGYKYGSWWTGTVIDTPEKEKPAAVEQMRELFDGDVYDGDQAIRQDIGEFDRLFMLLEYGVGGAVLLVLMLITYLYMSIFVTEEVPETALMKSMGFRNTVIKGEYMLRITLLLIISLILGETYTWTLGNIMLDRFMSQLEVTGMRFRFEFPVSFILIPLLMLGCFLLTSELTLRSIKHIGIWKISEE